MFTVHREKTYPHMHAPLKAIHHPKRKRALSCKPPEAETETEVCILTDFG